MQYQITPIRPDFLEQVRGSGIDDLGQPIEVLEAEGGEPCRDVLRRAIAGEKLILASYGPFQIEGPYKEYGPVFVLENASDEVVDYSNLPLPKGSETDYLGHVFVLKAYSQNRRILDAKLSTPNDAEEGLAAFFANPAVSFVVARFAAYGCYGFRVDRSM